MSKPHVILAVTIFALVTGACDEKNPVGPGGPASLDSLTAALRQQGASVTSGPSLPASSPSFFSTAAKIIVVNGANVSVFEYRSEAAADADAALVAPSGSPIGLTQVTFIGPPRFYKSGRLIALYVGSDPVVIQPLEAVLGQPFAQR